MRHAALKSVIVLAFAASTALAAISVGQPAPDFSVQDSNGKTHKLSQFKGKYVVLEWFNPGCPFVQKHYRSQNMQNMQKNWSGKNVVWLIVSSTNPGHSDYQNPDEANRYMKKVGAAPAAFLMDGEGKVGTLYEARVTPHMFVINPQGQVIYAGAIDDKRTTDLDDVKTARNHVSAALTEAMVGKPVSVANTTPYGCSVKY